jgi:hypothetical protein
MFALKLTYAPRFASRSYGIALDSFTQPLRRIFTGGTCGNGNQLRRASLNLANHFFGVRQLFSFNSLRNPFPPALGVTCRTPSFLYRLHC